MKVTTILALGLTLLCSSGIALAKKGSGTPQTHHCQLNGVEVQKGKKACLKAGGTWEQGAPSVSKPGEAPTPAK